jgi:hypothetical protein
LALIDFFFLSLPCFSCLTIQNFRTTLQFIFSLNLVSILSIDNFLFELFYIIEMFFSISTPFIFFNLSDLVFILLIAIYFI